MKFTFFSQRIVCMLLCFLFSAFCCAEITFIATYQGKPLPDYVYVSLYRDGTRMHRESSRNIITFKDAIGKYTYMTDATNHKGIVDGTSNVTVNLKFGKITFKLMDALGLPIKSSRVAIYEDGNEIASKWTNSDGVATFYLAPSLKYAYITEFSKGAIELPLPDEEIEIAERQAKISVIAKYRDLPVTGRYTLLKHNKTYGGIQKSISNMESGELSYYCEFGKSYRIKNEYDVFSRPFTPTKESISFPIEHYKVTFVSNEKDPNILKDFKICGASQTLYSSTDSKISDGKGHVVYYLMPGKYKYFHVGSFKEFEVFEHDTIINLTSQNKNVTFKNSSGKKYANLKFTVKCPEVSNITSEYTTDAEGKASIPYMGQDCYIQINDLGYFLIPEADSFEVFLVDVVFDANNLSPEAYTRIESNYGNKQLRPNESITLIRDCKYTYTISNNSSYVVSDQPLDTNSGTEIHIDKEVRKVIVRIQEEDGSPCEGISITCYSNGSYTSSANTDNNGQAVFILIDGSYEFKELSKTLLSVDISSDGTFVYTMPKELAINVSVNGKPWNGYFLLTKEETREMLNVLSTHGHAKVRIDEGEQCFASVGSMPYLSKISIKNNVTLNFVDTHILSEGDGLAFPAATYCYETPNCYMIEGENLHLVAVPAANAKFDCWIINGKRYESSVVDYKITGTVDAIAKFEKTDPSVAIHGIDSNNELNITVAGNYILFDQTVDGMATIYSSAGTVVKSSYVVSDRMDISNIDTGIYVLSLNSQNNYYSVKFVKE